MFAIQLGHPKIRPCGSGPLPLLKDCFCHIFRVEEESALIYSRGIPIRLRYREDLYANFDDILAMAWLIQRDEQGQTLVELENQLLRIRWEIRWDRDELTIDSTFAAKDDLYEAYADALNQQPRVQMSREAFLAEWHTLLHQVVVAMKTANVEIENGTERRKWEMLQRVDEQIAGYGQLYTRSA